MRFVQTVTVRVKSDSPAIRSAVVRALTDAGLEVIPGVDQYGDPSQVGLTDRVHVGFPDGAWDDDPIIFFPKEA